VKPDLIHPKLVRLYEYWLAKCRQSRLPSRSDIDPLEMAEWLGNLMLIEPDGSGSFRYRLYGTEFVEAFGREMTGRSIEELAPDERQIIADEYRLAREAGTPSARTYSARFLIPAQQRSGDETSRPATWERLVLPLAADRNTVDMLLVGAYEIAPRP
jgi:hypothetical protein